MDGTRLGIHEPADPGVRRAAEQVAHLQYAPVAASAVNHVHAIQVLGKFGVRAQVSEYSFQCHVRAHRDDVGHHEAAGRIRGENKDRLQKFPLVLVKRPDDALGDVVGKVGDEVRQIVQRQPLGGIHQRGGLHAFHDLGAHLVVELDQDFTLVLLVDQLPGEFAPPRRQRLDEYCGFARTQGVHETAQARLGVRRQHGAQGFARRGVARMLNHLRHQSSMGSTVIESVWPDTPVIAPLVMITRSRASSPPASRNRSNTARKSLSGWVSVTSKATGTTPR